MNIFGFNKEANTIYTFLFGIIIFLIPYFISLTNVFLILLVLIWLRNINREKHLTLLKRRAVYFAPFLLLFIIYLSSVTYSTNLNEAGSALEKRLPLLILPPVVISINFDKKSIEKIFAFYILSITLCCIVASAITIKYFLENPSEYYLEKALWFLPKSINFHAPYLALYLLISNIFCFYFFTKRRIAFSATFFLINNLFLLLISSRTALATNWVFIIILSTYYLYVNKGKLVTIINLLLIGFILWMAFLNIPYLHTKLSKITEPSYGVTQREVSSRASFEVIKENPVLGVGIGDVQIELERRLEDPKFEQYNVHNQYLHELMINGFLGFIFFALIFYNGFRLAFRKKDLVFTLFLVTFFLLFLTEVVLARYHGIMLFSLFYPLLICFNLFGSNNAAKISPGARLVHN